MADFVSTTTVTVLRGSGTDRFGDSVDVDQVVASGVPASIIEGSANSRSRPADGRTDQVRSYTVRMRTPVELLKYDRLRDERTGDVYALDEVVTPANPAGHRNRRATARRVV